MNYQKQQRKQLSGIDSVILDYDGTLADSMGIWVKIDIDFLKKRGFSLPDYYTPKVLSMRLYEAAEYTVEEFGLNETPRQVIEEWAQMAEYEYANNVELKPFVREYLDLLYARGIRMSVATSLSENLLLKSLERNGIGKYFEHLTFADEVGAGKESPAIFYRAAEKLGLLPLRCIVFDDILPAIISAKSAGFMTCGVYDKTSERDFGTIKKTADMTIRDFSEAPIISNFRP